MARNVKNVKFFKKITKSACKICICQKKVVTLHFEISMFTKEQILSAWNAASVVAGYDPNLVRKDACGAWIIWGKYGHNDSPFGWVVDHIFPRALGGDEQLPNLCAMQHDNNVSKRDDYPSYLGVVSSLGEVNVSKYIIYTIQPEVRQHLKLLYKDA